MTVRSPMALAALALAMLSAACQRAQPAPEELGRLAARMADDPLRADGILRDAGLEADELVDRVWRVAADAEEAHRYQQGFEAEQQGAAVPPGIRRAPTS